MSLSERAKGKQRATEANEQENDAASRRTVTVRFTEGHPDLELSIGRVDTVKEIKRQIRECRPELQRKRLRLIHLGRLLANNMNIYSHILLLEEQQRHLSTQDDASTEIDPNASKGGIWIHCSVGADMKPEDEDDAVQRTQLTPLRGFDRLAAAGFSPEDIATIRRQFHRSRGTVFNQPENELDQDNQDEEEHARALEEQWIDNMDGAAGTVLDVPQDGSNNDLYTTLLQGLLLGFFFPIIPFFFIREKWPAAFFSDDYAAVEPAPGVIYSKRMQMTLAVGLLLNIMYGALRYLVSG
jgi:hypothetical protein